MERLDNNDRSELEKQLKAVMENEKKEAEASAEKAPAEEAELDPIELASLALMRQADLVMENTLKEMAIEHESSKILESKTGKREKTQVPVSEASPAKERAAGERKAEKERQAAERKAEKERQAVERKAERERLAAERKAERERLAAERKTEKEKLSAEKKEEKQKRLEEKKAAKEAKMAEVLALKEEKRRAKGKSIHEVPGIFPPNGEEKPVKITFADKLVLWLDGKNIDRKRAKIAGITLGSIACLCLMGFYAYKTYYYAARFYEGSTINHIDCTDLTVDEAEALIRKKVENYSIDLKFRENKKASFAGDKIDYVYVSDGSVERIKKEQNPFLWFTSWFTSHDYTVAENISYDKKKLENGLKSLNWMKKENMKAPKDAYCTFTAGSFHVMPEVEGTTVDMKKALSQLNKAVASSSRSFDGEKEGIYVQPKLREEDKGLNEKAKKLNEACVASITYITRLGKTVVDGNTLIDWLTVDDQGNYHKDEAKIREKATEFVADFASKVDTVGTQRPFHTTSGSDIQVGGGDYGWRINQAVEVDNLVANIMNNDQVNREPAYLSREFTTENFGFGKTYIEVDIDDQSMYFYKDGDLIFSSEFVSGMMTRSRYTPSGIFTLSWKERDRVLRGQPNADGRPSYESHVNFWMPFNGGVGFHDAPWRGSFGGGIYYNGGSHGCINMPYSSAAKLYSLIDGNVPIIVFYKGGNRFE